MAGRTISSQGVPNDTASKWGVIGLRYHPPSDYVRVNAVWPGATLTDLVTSGTTDSVGREYVKSASPEPC
jgi:NAD(P)-dependent dehydrogenase (short-subunit alcohol dehydrogenase family)